MADVIEPQINKLMRQNDSLGRSESIKIEKVVTAPGTVRIANIIKHMKSKDSLKKEEEEKGNEVPRMLSLGITNAQRFRENMQIFLAKRLLSR